MGVRNSFHESQVHPNFSRVSWVLLSSFLLEKKVEYLVASNLEGHSAEWQAGLAGLVRPMVL